MTILLEAMLTFALAAALTAALVPLVRRICWQYGWLAQPNARSMHTAPIPTLGGVAILAGFFVALGASALFARFDPMFVRTPYESLRLLLLLIGVLLVAGISSPMTSTICLCCHGLGCISSLRSWPWGHTCGITRSILI